MKFEIGKYYQHSQGQVIHIVGRLPTFFYGEGLVSEGDDGNLSRIGEDEDSAVNWKEVSGWHRDAYDKNSIPEPTSKQQNRERNER